ncbi:hypothetical protein ACP70R_001490 [Stipagrostis hirtigluma subsp. patula]
MAASQRPTDRTASTFTTETARATHVFRITGYSLQKGLGRNIFIRSANFAVGGYDWCIRYYPDGIDEPGTKDFVSVYLELRSNDTDPVVRAIFDLRLVNQDTGLSCSMFYSKVAAWFRPQGIWGASKFKTRSELEASAYLRDDCLMIECDVTVIKESRVEETTPVADYSEVHQVPPSDLVDNLGKLMELEEGLDVTFKVKDQVFLAHKIVLAMRSPVFKAELYGPMKDKEMKSIKIEDMEPAVFKALLQFVYKDSLPVMDNLDRDEHKEMIKHLLVAADRYAIQRMKLMCENILCKRLDVDSVATTLVLADRHNCNKLKYACIGFINSSDRIDDVVASKGYEDLKRACPAAFRYICERATKFRKI